MASNENPFGHGDDLNPFAQVDVYNPFESSFSEKKAEPIAAPSTPISSFDSQNPFSPKNEMPELKFRAPEYEEVENFYEEDEQKVPMNQSQPFKETSSNQSQIPSTFTSTAGQTNITVQTYSSEEDDASFWQLKYYRRFFNVDSVDVMKRCLRSMWPFKNDFLEAVSHNPDFYGPYWVSTTLIFMLAACSNFSPFLETIVTPGLTWNYDFYKLIYGAGVIYGYVFGVPILFWLYFKYWDLPVSLIEILCIYGYSLFIYSPVVILCLIPFSWVKWVTVAIGCLLSTLFLIVNLWIPLRGRLVNAIITLIVIALLHIGLALTFRLYFFEFQK